MDDEFVREIDSIERFLEFVKSFFEIVSFFLFNLFILFFPFSEENFCLTGMDSEFVEEFVYHPGIFSRIWNI